MRISSSRSALFLAACLIATLCSGNQAEFRSIDVTIPVTSSDRATTNTSWQQILRGGSESSTVVEAQSEKKQQIPSLFQDESDVIYDRYAACLAATEGLRRIRDQTLQSQQQQSVNDQVHSKKNTREAKERATVIYAEKATKVIEAMGMPVSQFNSIGKVVCRDATLKQKVLEQAYLYRMQSNVALEEVPINNINDDDNNRPIMKSKMVPISNTKFQMFCEGMHAVEKLRQNLAEDMKRKFQLSELPSISTQPTLRPLLDSDVRKAIDSFPIRASKVVNQFGLSNDEFNELLQRTKANTMFRRKVLRNIGMIEREDMK